MSVEWFIARRYLVRAPAAGASISLISAGPILGVGVGVMALVIALALMTGVQGELRDRIDGASAHLYVYSGWGPFGDFRGGAQARRRTGSHGPRPGRVFGTRSFAPARTTMSSS
jgi:lipoprotein-releasing system permease protein